MSQTDRRMMRKMRRFLDTWTSEGPATALRVTYAWFLGNTIERYADRAFDRRYRVDTRGRTPLVNLTIIKRNFDYENDARRYESTSVATFRSVMSLLPEDLGDYVFIDIGSGKGKVVLLAAAYDLKRIIGIEFSQELHDVAQRNLSRYPRAKQRCHDIRLILDDAANLRIPNEKCIFYLYNPFRGAEHEFARVLGNIAESYASSPRKMYFLYLNPIHSHLFDDLPFVRLVRKERFGSGVAAIYESTVSTVAPQGAS